MAQGRVVAQLQIVLARNAEGLAHHREHLGLLDRVDAKVRLEIQIRIQHVARIARLLRHDAEHLVENGFAGSRGRRSRDRHRSRSRNRRSWKRGRRGRERRWWGWGQSRSAQSGRRSRSPLALLHVANHVAEGRIIAQLQVVLARNAEGLAHHREHFGLLDRVDAQIGFQIEIWIQHVARVASLLGDDTQNLLKDRFSSTRGRGGGHGRGRRGRERSERRGRLRSRRRRWRGGRSREGGRCRSRSSRREGRNHHPRIHNHRTRPRTRQPARLRRLTPRLSLVLDAQGALLNLNGRRIVAGNRRQPALVGRLIGNALLDALNATEERHGDLRAEARGQTQGKAHRVMPALG